MIACDNYASYSSQPASWSPARQPLFSAACLRLQFARYSEHPSILHRFKHECVVTVSNDQAQHILWRHALSIRHACPARFLRLAGRCSDTWSITVSFNTVAIIPLCAYPVVTAVAAMQAPPWLPHRHGIAPASSSCGQRSATSYKTSSARFLSATRLPWRPFWAAAAPAAVAATAATRLRLGRWTICASCWRLRRSWRRSWLRLA